MKSTSPLVSIIIPVYKVENYLRRCVDSVIKQTYDNIEIILVDDGSPDNCPLMCDEYAQKDKRVKVIHKSNGGLSDARNCGMKAATGEYITFVDSDDYVAYNYIEVLVNHAVKNEADIVCAGIEIVDEFEVTYAYRKSNTDFIINSVEAVEKLFRDEFPYNYSCGKLYHRGLWECISFPKNRLYEDMATTYRVVSKAKKINGIIDTLYFYEEGRPGNISSELNSSKAAKSFIHGCVNAIERIRFCQDNRTFLKFMPIVTQQLFIWSKLCIDASTKLNFNQYKNYCSKVKKIIKEVEVEMPLRLKLIITFNVLYYYSKQVICKKS